MSPSGFAAGIGWLSLTLLTAACSDGRSPHDARPGCEPDAPYGESANAGGAGGTYGPLPELWRDCGPGAKFGVSAAEFCGRLAGICGLGSQTTACLARYSSATMGRQACYAYYLCRAGLPPLPDQPPDLNKQRCCPMMFPQLTIPDDQCIGL